MIYIVLAAALATGIWLSGPLFSLVRMPSQKALAVVVVALYFIGLFAVNLQSYMWTGGPFP